MTLVYRDNKYHKIKIDSSLGPGKNQDTQDHITVKVSLIKIIKRMIEFLYHLLIEIGPGSYNIQNAYNKIIKKNVSIQCKATFKSKVQRFLQAKQNTKKQQSKLQNIESLLGHQKAKSSGKLCGILIDKNKLNNSIPSIPSSQQSFGYRIDQNNNKFILNQNPNVLLARKQFLYKQRKIIDSEKKISPSHYFIKNSKNQLAYKWRKQGQQKVQNSCFPDFTKYDNSIKWNQKGNIMNIREQRFSQGKFSIKQKLLINMMHKRFHDYMQCDFKKILNKQKNFGKQKKIVKNQQIFEKDQKVIFQKKKQIQCFLSRQKRLMILENEKKPQKDQIINYQRQDKSKNQIKKSKIPFQKGQQRFKIQINRQAGPGTYYRQILQKSRKNVFLKLTQNRFKKNDLSRQPGPGSYQLQLNKAIKIKRRRNKLTQSLVKIVNNEGNLDLQKFCLNNKKVQSNQHIKKSTSQKEKRIVDKEENKQDKKYQKQSKNNIINKMKQVVRQKKQTQVQIKQNKFLRFRSKKTRIPYNSIEKSPQLPGPGSFQVQRSLVKKTFNVTYT